MNGPHKQYIQEDILFNYIFHFELQEHVSRKVREMHLSGDGHVCFGDLHKDIFLGAPNKTCG